MELGRLLRSVLMPGASLNSILRDAAALALQQVRDEAFRVLPGSTKSLVNILPLAKAIGLDMETIEMVIQAQIDARNTDNAFVLFRTNRQAVIETFNAIKYLAAIDSDLPLPTAFEYNTQRDERVRQTHRELEGATLPPSDPFWRTYWPPNDWNCRCFVRSIYGSYSRYRPKTRYKPSEDFQRNLGEDFIKNFPTTS